MKTVMNKNIIFHDGRERANIIMFAIAIFLILMSNLCLLFAKIFQYMLFPDISSFLKMIGNISLFGSILLFIIIFIIDIILQYSEDVKRVAYYPLYDELSSSFKLLLITALALNALLVL